MKMVTLYRPTGPNEWQKVIDSAFRKWPPRLPGQPIFYPVCNEEYAIQIARDWNVKESGKGLVTRFNMDSKYLSGFDKHIVGGHQHEEYWIPAKELENFNRHIIGLIELIHTFE